MGTEFFEKKISKLDRFCSDFDIKAKFPILSLYARLIPSEKFQMGLVARNGTLKNKTDRHFFILEKPTSNEKFN